MAHCRPWEKTHPAWKLLVADHSPLIAAFLHITFVVPNQLRLAGQTWLPP